jgi:hypothetical protein
MGIEVQVWSEAFLMGWKDAEPPEVGEGGLTFETSTTRQECGGRV